MEPLQNIAHVDSSLSLSHTHTRTLTLTHTHTLIHTHIHTRTHTQDYKASNTLQDVQVIPEYL